MSLKTLFLAAGILATTQLSAQWRDEVYHLKGGWNAIYVGGDASYEELTTLLDSGDAAHVEEVWRWNPNPTAVRFTESPQIQTPGTPEWSVWKRGDAGASTLSRLRGRFGYLVKCSGTASDSYTVTLRQSPLVPQVQWVREGANLLGFQTPVSSPPSFTNYFQAFPNAIATGSDVFKYIGGDLGAANPVKVFSAIAEPLQRNQAYWFESDVVSDFQGGVKVECSHSDGLTFGDDGSLVRVTLRNRSNSTAQVTFTPTASESAPSGTRSIIANVPLMIREYDYNTLSWVETPLGSSATRFVTAQSSLDVYFVVDRTHVSMMAANKGDYFASLLKLEDAAGQMEVYLPVSAEKGSLEGLWLGNVILNGVAPLPQAGSPNSETPSTMSLRMLLHVDEAGTIRMLSQAYLGILEGSGAPGVATSQSLLDGEYLAAANRFTAAHLPLDQIITAGSGGFGIGQTLEREVTIPFNDPTNPFIHQYHPDHDNLDARFETISLPTGVTPYNAKLSHGAEAPGIRRTCSFAFTASPPGGGAAPLGWGTNVLGGTFVETLEGVHKQPLSLSGTFELRRVSDIGTLTTP